MDHINISITTIDHLDKYYRLRVETRFFGEKLGYTRSLSAENIQTRGYLVAVMKEVQRLLEEKIDEIADKPWEILVCQK
jgi:hypothetical protein